MTLTTLIFATLLLVLPSIRMALKETFIVHKTTADALMVVPTHTPGLWLRPENAVAKVIGEGEALACRVAPETLAAIVAGEPARIHTIRLDCDGAKFTVTGVQFEGVE